MLVFECLKWWYGRGWGWRLRSQYASLQGLAEYFSVGAMLRTLFAPYRQTLVADGSRKGLANVMSAMVDSLVSRFVGFFYRLILLFVAGLLSVGQLLIMIISAVIWPLVPVVPIFLIVLIMGGK